MPEQDTKDILRTIRTRRDKVLQLTGEDRFGDEVTWYVSYNGKFGWRSYAEHGTVDQPDEDEVKDALDVYDHAEVIGRSELPDEVRV